MSGLKQLKSQMSSVQTTMKITNAMRMIAVSKLRKSHALLLNAYPYLDEITRMLRRLVRSVSFRQEQLQAVGSEEVIALPDLLKGRDNAKKHLLVCVSSDEGLCGHFNHSIVNKAAEVIDYIKKQSSEQLSVMCFGTRGGELLKRKYPDLSIHIVERKLNKNKPLFIEAERIAISLTDAFHREVFDTCTVVFAEFETAAVQHIKVEQAMPIQIFHHRDKWAFLNESEDPNYVKRDLLGQKKLKTSDARFFSAIGGQKIRSPLGAVDSDALLKESTRLPDAYDYECSDLQILDFVLPLFVEAHVYKILLNTMASENAARMIAMESASKNGADMLKSFNKKYHRRRQELVTKDLTEVVAGSMS